MKTMEMTATQMCREYCVAVRRDLRRIIETENAPDFDCNLYEDGKDEDGNAVTLDAYISDALDVEYTLNSRKNLIGVTLYVALGGPNVWIDTRAQEVRAAWADGKSYAALDEKICGEIDRYFEGIMEF